MKAIKIVSAAAVLMFAAVTYGSGFSLYQYSATSVAMGGALVGKAMDASANFINPATLTDLTNIWVTAGFITEHPRGRVRVRKNGVSQGEHGMEPGMFALPHFQLAVPLPYDFAFGFGIAPEFGLGTKFSDDWVMNGSTQETTIQSLSFVPNLAYKVTDKWSIGAGLRWLYFDFEQDARPMVAYDMSNVNPALPGGVRNCGSFKHHLHGDDAFRDFGWQVGTKYDILDNLSAGLVYKSAIDVTVEGKSEAKYPTVNPMPLAIMDQVAAGIVQQGMGRVDGDADCELTLPQSITGGLNWDVTDAWHLGTAVSWTQWSTIDTLDFNLNGTSNPRRLGWEDTWRVSVGSAYDVTTDWTAMLSYVYDMDSTSSDQSSAMLPRADRHIASAGLTWRAWRGLEFTLMYSCIFMHGKMMETTNAVGDTYRLATSRGFCHAAGLSVTYRF